jgi:hypothetical protein
MIRHPHFSHLQGWTPIAYHARPEPAVEWADLRGHAFDNAFFSRTVDDWRAAPHSPTVRTDLSALEYLDEQPSLEPNLIIAHPSRCGSTFLARLASVEESTLLVSEPALVTQLLSADLRRGLGSPVDDALRRAVRALGRIRSGNERRYVLKLNSRMVRFLPNMRRAFPNTPIVWLQRRPAEIVESNLKHSPYPAKLLGERQRTGWVLRRIALAFLGATAFVDDSVRVLDYRDLPDAAWTQVTQLMGLEPTEDLIARMRLRARTNANSGEPYAVRTRQPLPEDVLAVVHRTLDPMYDALARRQTHREPVTCRSSVTASG